MTDLRYTGTQPTSFRTGRVGRVEPGGEFSVADDLAGRFLRRPDVELATPETGRAGDDGSGDDGDDDAAGAPAPAGPESGPVTLQRAE